MTQRIGFLGGGNMATAIIGGLLSSGVDPKTLTVCDPDADTRERHAQRGIQVSANCETLKGSDILVLAVKPQVFPSVNLQVLAHPNLLTVSVMAGIPTSRIETALGGNARVVRSMPNTPMMIGQGMVAIAAGRYASAADLDTAEKLFAPAARVLRTTEDRLDAVTAVSGSGPAYIFRFAECLVSGAKSLGFSDEEAVLLVRATLKGSVDYLEGHPDFPAERLRRQVTSPGGTTAAALSVFDGQGLERIVAQAMQAALNRAQELSKA
jgi:pyrroline-5-carboxylate reductase